MRIAYAKRPRSVRTEKGSEDRQADAFFIRSQHAEVEIDLASPDLPLADRPPDVVISSIGKLREDHSPDVARRSIIDDRLIEALSIYSPELIDRSDLDHLERIRGLRAAFQSKATALALFRKHGNNPGASLKVLVGDALRQLGRRYFARQELTLRKIAARAHELSTKRLLGGERAKSPAVDLQHENLYKDRMDVQSTDDLAIFLRQNVKLSASQADLVASTAWTAVLKTIIMRPCSLRDPVTGLVFPPSPRKVDYQSRPRDPRTARRMTVEQYLADSDIGWGEYTRHCALTSFWLSQIDKPLYDALRQMADRVAALEPETARGDVMDRVFLNQGVLTLRHLDNPPPGREWIAAILAFTRKQEQSISQGRPRRDDSATR